MDLPKGISLLTATPDNINLLWTKFNEHPKLFMDPERGDKQAFTRQIIAQNSVYFFLEDVGTIYFTDIILPYIAKFHLMFWDGKLRGREEICKAMLGWAFEEFQLVKIWTSIPVFAKVQKKFAERIGFLREGFFRSGYPCLGTNYDVYLYGMLREDYDGTTDRRGIDSGDGANRLSGDSSGRDSGDLNGSGKPAIIAGKRGEGALIAGPDQQPSIPPGGQLERERGLEDEVRLRENGSSDEQDSGLPEEGGTSS